MFDHTIIIHYVARYFVPNLSQVLQLGHTVSANSVSPERFIFSAVQLRFTDVQLVAQSVDGVVLSTHNSNLKDPALLVGKHRKPSLHLAHLPFNQLMVGGKVIPVADGIYQPFLCCRASALHRYGIASRRAYAVQPRVAPVDFFLQAVYGL